MPDPYEEALKRLKAEQGDDGGEEPSGLDELLGQILVDAGSGTQGILKTRTDRRTGQRVYWLSEDGRAFNLGPSPTLMSPSTFQLYTLTPMGTAMSGGKASQFQLEQFGFLEGAGAAGSTYHPPAWRPGEQQMEQQALQHRIDQDQADLAWAKEEFGRAQAAEDRRAMEYAQLQMNMLEKRLENDRRTLAYQMGMQERGTLISEKAETGRELMRLGPDPFHQAAILGGGVQRGITPQQTVVGQAQAFMKQPLPQVSMDMDVAQLEQALSQMQKQGMTQPQIGGFGIGMAQGGVIEMEQKDGAFSMKPATEKTVLVGDGAGIIPGVTEALTVGTNERGAFSVKVTPIVGTAQGGMEMSVLQGLSPLYTDFAKMPYPGREGLLAGVPRAATTPLGLVSYGSRDPFSMHGLSALGAMGYQPSLMRFGGGPGVFYRDPTTGELQHVGSRDIFEGSGFNWQDVVQAGEGTRESFTFGSPLTSPLSAGQTQGEGGAFGSLGTILMEATTGAILPAIHKIARQLAQWKAAGDYRYDMALSAYGNALDPRTGLPIGGISPQYVDAIVSAATPERGAFGGRRIGWTGGAL